MIKKLLKNGNSWCLIVTKSMREMMDVDPEKDEVHVTMDGDRLTVRKVDTSVLKREEVL